MRRFLRQRIVEPLLGQLTQGVSPERLALAVTLGVIIGCFPVLGTTTLICVAVAWALKLNQPATQVGNFIATPLVVAFYVPLFDLGAWLFSAPPVGFTLSQIKAELKADVLATMQHYAWANARAVVAWAMLALPVAAALYWSLRFVLRRVPLPKVPAERRSDDSPG